jgi:uncharacterized protein YkwD
VLCTVCLVLLMPASAHAACDGAHTRVTANGIDAARHTVRCLLNEIRAGHGLHRLHRNRRLRRAATRHSRDMVVRGYFGHVSPGGGTLVTRAAAVGYLRRDIAWTIGENIGWRPTEQATPSGMVRAWMASAPHAANVLSATFRDLGIGVALGSPFRGAGVTYTTLFGARWP